MKKYILLALLLLLPAVCFAQETLTISTYYPSPYGSYKDLQTETLTLGDNVASPQVGGVATFVPSLSAPATPVEGMMYYDNGTHQFKYRNNTTTWQNLGTGLTYISIASTASECSYGGPYPIWYPEMAPTESRITITAGTWLIYASFEAKAAVVSAFGWGITNGASGPFIYSGATDYVVLATNYNSYSGSLYYTTASSKTIYISVRAPNAGFFTRRTFLSALKLQ